MELGAHVWLRTDSSHWGWVPAVIRGKEEKEYNGVPVINLTLTDDVLFEGSGDNNSNHDFDRSFLMPDVEREKIIPRSYSYGQKKFKVVITVDPEQLKTADHDDIKLRNLPQSLVNGSEDQNPVHSPNSKEEQIVGGVDDLIGLTHLHEPAILHALRLRYDANIIYTSTGPILIAINPFKSMPLYSNEVMEIYRLQGEQGVNSSLNPINPTPFKRRTNDYLNNRRKQMENTAQKLPPHVFQIADDAYRTMLRGLENSFLMHNQRRGSLEDFSSMPTNQSILVSGESGAGKTVTTKIVLNYFAMLSRQALEASMNMSYLSTHSKDEDVTVEQQVLQSNPILESFGNARTMRNDNSSRFGKYIDIQFTESGRLSGAQIETYLLEKVRLIQPSKGERNYHVFYQFLSSATDSEREQFYLDDFTFDDFKLLNQTGTYDRRDGVSDETNHQEMLEAMITLGFKPIVIQSLMRLVVGILFAGNMNFTEETDDTCCLLEDHASLAVASLLGVTFEELDDAITCRTITAGLEVMKKHLSQEQAIKASEALIKALYGAAFDYIVSEINSNIGDGGTNASASIGVLDIFGFETFGVNNFEQLCINYTNEALQQQFNKFVFKLEQQEYEKEGILWKFITFPDNQDVLDLIDGKHVGVLAILDEQCVIPQSTDEKFTRYLYRQCTKHQRFSATSAQKVDFKFNIEHYAGPVEYSTNNWLEKNKDQLPAATSLLLNNSTFDLISTIKRFVRTEIRKGRSTIISKSVGAQFASQLRELRGRIDTTTPHYIRCLKPNDDLMPNYFEPKNIVEQLRCGGVLEAVRVSRAGFPTRYPHDVFLARYYILGNRHDSTPMSPIHGMKRHQNDREEELKRLISKVASDIWYSDHQMFLHFKQAEEKDEEMRSTKKHTVNNTPVAVYAKGSQVVGGPQSLALKKGNVSSHVSSMAKKIQKQAKRRQRYSVPNHLQNKLAETHKVARPQSESEFMDLDFVSRCAVAGIQLGRTKVFLRREAFDRLEAMRAQAFIWSASTIQAMVRGKIYREQFKRWRAATIAIQAVARRFVSNIMLERQRLNAAATKIQSAWRMTSAKYSVYKCYLELKNATVLIQRSYRRYYRRKNHALVTAVEYDAACRIQSRVRGVLARNIFFSFMYGLIRLQAINRGRSVRANILNATPSKSTLSSSNASFFATELANVPEQSRELTPLKPQNNISMNNNSVPSEMSELYKSIHDEDWAKVESILDDKPELAEQAEPTSGELPLHIIARHPNAWTLLVDMILVLYPKALIHRDSMGALPMHHAAAHNNIAALEIIHSAYKEGINDYDLKGRLPIHVAAEFDAVDSVKYLLSNSPEGAFTMVHRPADGAGGGLPLHVACRNYSSIGCITALLSENFAAAKRCDENGDLPLHLLLRCGEVVDQVVVKTLLTCFSSALSRTDMNGDLPLSISVKHQCKPEVINTVLMPFTDAAKILCGSGHSPLHLAFENGADDRTLLGLLNHAPEMSIVVDKKTGLLPIQVATEHEHSHFIVHNLLKRDMPIDVGEKVRAQLLPHQFSWNHIVCNTDDMYHQVVTKVLSQCTQPQVLALAHVEGPDGKIALASATPVCKHELRVMLRLFNTLEVVNQRPAYTNPISDTQIFYALRYEPPPTQSNAFTILHEDKHDAALNDYIEEWDDTSVTSGLSRQSMRSTLSNRSQQSIDRKLRLIKKEKGQQVIAKLTSRSDIVERELKVRKEYHLSRHYVPAVISVHHTVQHAAYSEAMAEPGYCITMEGADTTAENLMLDSRRSGKQFPKKALKRIGISLLHMHEHGLVHCDFGTHNIGKFGSRWKLLGVGGSVPVGEPSDPNRGFYHPPESIVVESKRAPLGKKTISACVVSIPSYPSYDIWAYGVVIYEAVCGIPLSPYACRGKRSMSALEVSKIGRWDDQSLRKALKSVSDDDEDAKDLLRCVLNPDSVQRMSSMRDVLEHPFFDNCSEQKELPPRQIGNSNPVSDPSKKKISNRSRSSHSGNGPIRDENMRSEAEAENLAPTQAPQQKPLLTSRDSNRQSVSNGSAPFGDENLLNGSSKLRARESRDSSTTTNTKHHPRSSTTSRQKEKMNSRSRDGRKGDKGQVSEQFSRSSSGRSKGSSKGFSGLKKSLGLKSKA